MWIPRCGRTFSTIIPFAVFTRDEFTPFIRFSNVDRITVANEGWMYVLGKCGPCNSFFNSQAVHGFNQLASVWVKYSRARQWWNWFLRNIWKQNRNRSISSREKMAADRIDFCTFSGNFWLAALRVCFVVNPIEWINRMISKLKRSVCLTASWRREITAQKYRRRKAI